MVVLLRPQTLVCPFSSEKGSLLLDLLHCLSESEVLIESFIEGSEGSLANLHTSYVPVLS